VNETFSPAALPVVLVSGSSSLGLLVAQLETDVVLDANEEAKLNNFGYLSLINVADLSFTHCRFFLSFT